MVRPLYFRDYRTHEIGLPVVIEHAYYHRMEVSDNLKAVWQIPECEHRQKANIRWKHEGVL